MPLDSSQRAAAFQGMVKRVPIGLCSFITPFNFPLNLVMHKIAPAIASGCPFILKPAPQTPLTAMLLGELLMKCQPTLPTGFFSVLPLRVADAATLTRLGLTGDILLATADFIVVVKDTGLAKYAGDFDTDTIPIHVSLVLRHR
jgi:acyl-CoA reductase-like NAD-dependent aldehyde dehydrogenase